jgi:hypothetical protein
VDGPKLVTVTESFTTLDGRAVGEVVTDCTPENIEVIFEDKPFTTFTSSAIPPLPSETDEITLPEAPEIDALTRRFPFESKISLDFTRPVAESTAQIVGKSAEF